MLCASYRLYAIALSSSAYFCDSFEGDRRSLPDSRPARPGQEALELSSANVPGASPPKKAAPPQTLFAALQKEKQGQRAPRRRLSPSDLQLPRFRMPSLFVAVRELFFIPCLLWVGLRSKSRLLLAIVVVQPEALV